MKTRFIAATMMLVSLWGIGAPLALSASIQVSSQTAGSKTHSCCPHGHAALALPIFVSSAPARMPCGGQSPCCAKQAPAKPALVALNHQYRPGLAGTAFAANGAPSDIRTGTATTSTGLAPPLFPHSTVLRI